MKINSQKQPSQYSEAEFNIVGLITYGQVMSLRKFKDDEVKMQDEMIKLGVASVNYNGENITDKARIVEIFNGLGVDEATEIITAISELIKINKTPKVAAA